MRASPIRVGIAGLGRGGWDMHCSEIKDREDKFRIVAACDVLKDRLERVAREHGCRTYTDIAELIADPEVELVDIATRSTEHVPHARMALKAGKDVFLEKPIAVTYAEARRLMAAASRSRGRLYVRHNRRFEPAFQHVREILASGVLGEVFAVKLRRGGYQRRDDWQTLRDCGGGQLLNWGPHIVDHGLRLLESPVAEVWSDLKRVAAVGDAEDHLKVILRGRNGRVVDIEISGGAAIREPEYIVLGRRGGLESDGETIRLRYLDPRRKLRPRRAQRGTPGVAGFGSPETLAWIEKTVKVGPKLGCDAASIWDYLYDAIRKGRPFPITLEESLEVMRVISLARRGR